MSNRVVLIACGSNKEKVVKTISELSKVGRMEAQLRADHVPCVLYEGLTDEQAINAFKRLSADGAYVRIENDLIPSTIHPPLKNAKPVAKEAKCCQNCAFLGTANTLLGQTGVCTHKSKPQVSEKGLPMHNWVAYDSTCEHFFKK